MKRTTCLEGARLLTAYGLKERGLNPNRLRSEGSTFLVNSEYCRSVGTYFPNGIPSPTKEQ